MNFTLRYNIIKIEENFFLKLHLPYIYSLSILFNSSKYSSKFFNHQNKAILNISPHSLNSSYSLYKYLQINITFFIKNSNPLKNIQSLLISFKNHNHICNLKPTANQTQFKSNKKPVLRQLPKPLKSQSFFKNLYSIHSQFASKIKQIS